MTEGNFRYCDVSLPVPLDQTFTYELPETLRHRVKRGCRLLVPFGSRKLTGVVLEAHNTPPDAKPKLAFQLLGEEPAISEELLALANWVASYYCAPLGEVLRAMTPLASEVRTGKLFSLTDKGRDTARQIVLTTGEAEDPTLKILQLLENRPLSATYLSQKVPNATNVLKSLQRRGFVAVENTAQERDPLRAPADKLMVEFASRQPEGEKLRKAERELLAFLELHPGPHLLSEVESQVPNASVAGRAMARRGLVTLKPVGISVSTVHARAPHLLNT